MSVCLHFLTFKDVRRFILVNSKCHETIKMLKVNPFFVNSPSIEQFCQFFHPTTVNVLDIAIFDLKLFSNCECIKNPYFDEYINEKKDEIKSVIPMIKSFDLDSDSDQTNFFIKKCSFI
ncbi:Uncharacterized protein QTN25_007672 [Entamoeba marina]